MKWNEMKDTDKQTFSAWVREWLYGYGGLRGGALMQTRSRSICGLPTKALTFHFSPILQAPQS